jgi:DNA polymerase
MRQWVQDRVTYEQLALMTVEDKISIDKSVRANLLACDDLDPDVREVVQSADDLWASSVAKFARMAALADEEDHRVRGAFVFNGGAATGRLSSYGLQVHNFTRKCAKEPQTVRDAMVADAPIVPAYGKRITDVLKGMLRPALIPAPGKQFVVADWSGIEARCNPWLSGSGDEVLNVFRAGRDIYIREAASIFRCDEADVTPDMRQVGKVAILSCGYGGSVGAFAAMGRNYGVHLPEADARRTVNAWRRANSWAVRYWQALESAYMRAMRNKGKEFTAGRVTYLFDGVHLWYVLPSGRVLCYPHARFETDGVSYAKCAWKPKQDATEWPRARLWSGLAAENICQAVANDLLRHSLRQVDDVVLTIHDELVLESATPDVEALRLVMCTPPAWAPDLPLSVDIKVMARYGK